MSQSEQQTLEVTDIDVPPTKATPIELARAIVNGKLGWLSKMRAVGTEEWQPVSRASFYGELLPFVIPKERRIGKTMSDIPAWFHFSPTFDKIVAKRRELIAAGQKKDGCFYVPIPSEREMLIPSKMFQFGSGGVYAAPLLLPSRVQSPGKMLLYMIVTNLTKKEAECDITFSAPNVGWRKGAAVDIQSIPKDAYKMNILPGKTLSRSVSLNVASGLEPKEYSFSVTCKVSTKELVTNAAVSYVAATALLLAASALAGGGIVPVSYNTAKGFSVKFKVVKSAEQQPVGTA